MEKKRYNQIRINNYLDGKEKKLTIWEKLYLETIGVYPWKD